MNTMITFVSHYASSHQSYDISVIFSSDLSRRGFVMSLIHSINVAANKRDLAAKFEVIR